MSVGDGEEPRSVDAEFERLMRREGLGPGPNGAAQARGPAHDPLADDDGFVPPDPGPGPGPSDRAVAAWVGLGGGIGLVLLVVLAPGLPRWLAPIGGSGALAGLIGLLLLAPRSREDGDGAQV